MPAHGRISRAFALVAGLVVLLAGCALPWAQGATTKTPVALPDAQQIFRPLMVGVKNGDLDSLDPAVSQDVGDYNQFASDYNLAQLIFPPLVTLDAHNQVTPWGADSWTASADGLTWTFHLRAGMRWSDGVPIDATTYAYSLNRSLDPCVKYYVYVSRTSLYDPSRTGTEMLKRLFGSSDGFSRRCPDGAVVYWPDTLVGKLILAPDPLTLVLRLSHPTTYFPMLLTYPTAWAQPKQLIEHYGIDTFDQVRQTIHRGWTDHLAGFGGNLFTVKRWDHAGHFDLVRNEAFWGPKPTLREIDWTLYQDFNTMWTDYKAGKGDYVSTRPLSGLATTRATPGFHQDLDPTVLYLTLDWTLPPFDDVRVRQAFDLALDRRANSSLLGSTAITPTIHMVPEDVPGYNPSLSDPAGRVGEAALTPDIAMAGALWQAYVRDRWGGDASKAPPVVYMYGGQIPGGQLALAQAYKQQWEAAMPGLQVILSHLGGISNSWAVYHMVSTGWRMDYPDPQEVLSMLFRTGSPYVYSPPITVPTAARLMDQADANADPAARLAQYQQAEQQLVDAVAWIPVGQLLNTYLVRPRVAGDYRERATGLAALSVWMRLSLVRR